MKIELVVVLEFVLVDMKFTFVVVLNQVISVSIIFLILSVTI